MRIIKNLIKYIKGDLPMSKKVTVEGNKVIIEGVTDEEIKNLIGHTNLKELGNVTPGKVIKIGNLEFIVFKQLGGETDLLWRYALAERRKFDKDTVNYAESSIRKYLNTEVYEMLAAEVGAENIVEHAVDLTTEDGLKVYDSVTDKVSLITEQMYKENRDVIGPNLDSWWWLATACSKQELCGCVRVVCNRGILHYDVYYFDGGVRPFCILKSNILVSEVEE